MKTKILLSLALLLVLVIQIQGQAYQIMEDEGCLFFADAGNNGQAVFTALHPYFYNPTAVFLAGHDMTFNPGDTLIIKAHSAFNPAVTFQVSIPSHYSSSAQTAPSEFRYTITDNLFIEDVLLTFDFGDTSGLAANTILASYSFTCVTGGTSSGSESAPPDNRMNWQSGDAHIAILYPGAEGLDVYIYETNEYIDNFIDIDDLAPYVDNPPAENTLIRSEGMVSVYILTTGQIQFNLGPDAEGKIYIIRMDDLDGTNMETEYFDPNE